jgi:hypothetical protein
MRQWNRHGTEKMKNKHLAQKPFFGYIAVLNENSRAFNDPMDAK